MQKEAKWYVLKLYMHYDTQLNAFHLRQNYFYVPRISLILSTSFRLEGGIEPLRLSSATGLKPTLRTTGDH